LESCSLSRDGGDEKERARAGCLFSALALTCFENEAVFELVVDEALQQDARCVADVRMADY
jgi:hypothetical protein